MEKHLVKLLKNLVERIQEHIAQAPSGSALSFKHFNVSGQETKIDHQNDLPALTIIAPGFTESLRAAKFIDAESTITLDLAVPRERGYYNEDGTGLYDTVVALCDAIRKTNDESPRYDPYLNHSTTKPVLINVQEPSTNESSYRISLLVTAELKTYGLIDSQPS